MNAIFTDHARTRMQQRGISQALVEHMFRYASEQHDRHGAVVLFLDKAARRRMQREQRLAPAEVERIGSIYVVVALDGSVVTTGHRRRRVRRH